MDNPSESTQAEAADRFELQNLFAEGSYGYVYLGLDRLTGKKVVIKRLKLDLLKQDPQAVARFAQEGEALRRLNHPNIVSLVGFIDQDGQRSIVMEYVPGGSLEDLIENLVYLPVGRVLDISLELADALSRAHHLHILHRDLKPGNVLLAEDGTPRLTDFGMARLERDNARLTPIGAVIGSPMYMPPEALRGEELTARSDIWSLGILIFEMLAGKPPFEGDRITVTITRIMRDPLPDIQLLRPETPPALGRLLQRMLAKEPNQRIGSMRQVAAELEKIRSGQAMEEELPVLPLQPVESTPVSEAGRKNLNLPAQPTPFVGREEELTALSDLLTQPGVRLVTIVAIGGMGKTRMALAVAEMLAQNPSQYYPDGIIFVPLASVETLAALSTSLARGLNISLAGEADPLAQISSYLHQRSMLIVLDNFEQLVEKSTFFLEELLDAAPRITLLVTSRIALQLSVEWRFDLTGLAYPQGLSIETSFSASSYSLEANEVEEDTGDEKNRLVSYASVQLFLQAVQQSGVDFKLTPANTRDVVRICQIVAGMPLAIKLAASWLRVMTTRNILLEIDRGLDLFTSSMRDTPERQRSLRSIFEGTWELLNPDQKRGFAALSVFRGGFTTEAAMQVTSTSPVVLVGLVDSGLLQLERKGEGSANFLRYSIHELVRQYASGKLSENPEEAEKVKSAHCRYYAQFIHDQEMNLRQGSQSIEILIEIDNIRSAWRYAVEKQLIENLQLAHWGMAIFFWLQGWFTEAYETFSTTCETLRLNLPPEKAETTATRSLLIELSANASAHSQFRGLLAQAEHHLEIAGEIAEKTGRPDLSAFVLDRRARLSHEQGNLQAALDCGEEARALYEAIGDKTNVARMLSHLGAVNVYRQEYSLAFQQLDECLRLFYTRSLLPEVVIALSNLAQACLKTGAYPLANAQLEEANKLYTRMQIPAHTTVLNLQGLAAEINGDYDQARHFFQESQEYCMKVGNKMREAIAGAFLGNLLRLDGFLAEAEMRLLQSLSVHRQLSRKLETAWDLYFLALVMFDKGNSSSARQYLDEASVLFDQMSDREGKAVCLAGYSRLESALGNSKRALELAKDSLLSTSKAGAKPLAIHILVDLAACLFTLDEAEKALSLLYYCADAPEARYETRKQAKAFLSAQKTYQPRELMDKARLLGMNMDYNQAIEYGLGI